MTNREAPAGLVAQRRVMNRSLAAIGVMVATTALASAMPVQAIGPALAQPSPAQTRGLDQALGSMPASLRTDVVAAMPTLRPYLTTLMCVQDDMAIRGLVEKYVGSRGTAMFNGWSGAMSPAKRIRHHATYGKPPSTRNRTEHG